MNWFEWCCALEDRIKAASPEDLQSLREVVDLVLAEGETTWAPYAAARLDALP